MAYGWDDEVRADGPASRFRFGDARGSSSAADTVGGTAGSVRGGVTFGQASLVDSDADGAAAFDGSSGFVLIADRAGVKLAAGGAVEAWVYATSYRDSRGLGGCIYDGGTNEPIVRFADSLDGTILARINSVGNICLSNGTVPLNVRTHVRVTFTLTSGRLSAKVFINGSNVTGTVTAQTVTANALAKTIGGADQGANNWFQGTLDEVAIYNAATPADNRARAHFNAAFGVPRTGPRPLTWMDQTYASSARTLLRVTRPTGVKVGDLLCLSIVLRSTSVTPFHVDWEAPAGNRQTNTTASKNHELVFLCHRVTAADPATWDITWDGSSVTCEAFIRVVRGAPASGEPINIVSGSASSSATTTVPFAGAISTGRGLAMCVWARYSSGGFPNQPDYWHYGAGLSGGVAAVGTFERQQLGATRIPYMTNFTGGSDAWTTLQVVINDGGIQNAFATQAIGLDGVNSPNDRGNPGWPDGYTPALSIGANFIRTDFGPGWSQADADAEFSDAAARGMQILPIFWSNQQISTINRATFTTSLALFVARYGPGGSFWASRSDGYLAPVYVELFNEPYGTWFVGTVEPATYAEYFISSVIAGRAANPRCKYLIAGIDRYFTSGWQDWFAPMFAAQPTLAQYIDGVTVHLYGTKPLDLTWFGNYDEWGGIIDTIVPYLAGQGLDIGGACKLWVTEGGFTTTSSTGSPNYGVSQADQASMMLDALRLFFGRWQDVLAGFFFYRYRDGVTDTRENRWGIMNNDNSAKPAFNALMGTLPSFSSGLLSPSTGVLGGTLRAGTGALSTTTDPTNAVRHGAFLLSVTRSVVTTTDPTNATVRGGFLRAPNDAVVTTTDPTNATVRGGFLRAPNGALVVTASTAGATRWGSYLRSTNGALVIG